MRVAIYARILAALYFSALASLLVRVPWQRRYGPRELGLWVHAGYHWSWWAVYFQQPGWEYPVRIDRARLGVELLAVTAGFAAVFALLETVRRIFGREGV